MSDSDTSSENETELDTRDMSGLNIEQEEADQNYVEAGTLVDEPEDEISLTKYHHLQRGCFQNWFGKQTFILKVHAGREYNNVE